MNKKTKTIEKNHKIKTFGEQMQEDQERMNKTGEFKTPEFMRLQRETENLMNNIRLPEIIIPHVSQNSTYIHESDKEDLADRLVARMRKTEEEYSMVDDPVEIYLSNDGILHKNPKEKFCVNFTGEKQVKVLRVMSDRKILSTEGLTRIVGSKNNEALRKLIGNINRKARIGLKLKENLIIPTAKGYIINPSYIFKEV